MRPFVKQVTQLSGSGPLPGRLYPKLYPLSVAFGVIWYENSIAKDREFEPGFESSLRSQLIVLQALPLMNWLRLPSGSNRMILRS